MKKRRMLRVFSLISAALIVFLISGGSAQAHGGGPGVTVQPLTAKPGDVITVHGEALGKKATVEVRITGSGVDIDLGEAQADEEGDFTTQFRVPATLKDGTYQLQAKGTQSASVALDVVSNAGSTTGTTSTVVVQERSRPLLEIIGLIALFGVLSGLGLFFASSKRPRSA